MAGTRQTSKVAVGLRIAPATLAQVEELIDWLGAPSKNWIFEHAIERWHGQELARRCAEPEAGDGGEGEGEGEK